MKYTAFLVDHTMTAMRQTFALGFFLQLIFGCQGFAPSGRPERGLVTTFATEETPAEWYNAELVDDENDDDDEDWVPDRVKAAQKRRAAKEYYTNAAEAEKKKKKKKKVDDKKEKARPVYTEEEEELIKAMDGMREPGYLGDSTLMEIATDYSVPVCYLADVLCSWGVPVPISVNEQRLGDMVTGEQAFAVLEAIHSLDVAALQERYSNYNLMELCDLQALDLKDAFQMAVKEGWSLPFGVQTHLRVEQEDDLVRVLGSSYGE